MRNAKKVMSPSLPYVGVVLVVVVVMYFALTHIERGSESLSQYSSSAANLQFKYPSYLNLKLSEGEGGVRIAHMIEFSEGVCADERGVETAKSHETKSLFDDVSFLVSIDSANIREIIHDFNDRIKVNEYGESSLSEVTIGGRQGYFEINAVEMCGTIEYYFPIDSGTLLVSRSAEVVALRNLGRFDEVKGAATDDEIDRIFETVVKTAEPLK